LMVTVSPAFAIVIGIIVSSPNVQIALRL